MKLKILVKIIEKIFGMANHGDEPRADMYLPERLLAMSLVFLAGGIACGVYAAISFATWAMAWRSRMTGTKNSRDRSAPAVGYIHFFR